MIRRGGAANVLCTPESSVTVRGNVVWAPTVRVGQANRSRRRSNRARMLMASSGRDVRARSVRSTRVPGYPSRSEARGASRRRAFWLVGSPRPPLFLSRSERTVLQLRDSAGIGPDFPQLVAY